MTKWNYQNMLTCVSIARYSVHIDVAAGKYIHTWYRPVTVRMMRVSLSSLGVTYWQMWGSVIHFARRTPWCFLQGHPIPFPVDYSEDVHIHHGSMCMKCILHFWPLLQEKLQLRVTISSKASNWKQDACRLPLFTARIFHLNNFTFEHKLFI
jgi:hypothetical protein